MDNKMVPPEHGIMVVLNSGERITIEPNEPIIPKGVSQLFTVKMDGNFLRTVRGKSASEVFTDIFTDKKKN